jgi:sugar O-acyltransferase (sialic acid O-acetyltransferase NeuD family)
MKQLLIFPCNGNGREALDCLGQEWECVGFLDDAVEKIGTTVHGIPVFDRSALQLFPDAFVLAVPGSPTSFSTRDKAIGSLGIAPERFATVIHPFASISPRSEVGLNVLLMSGVVITSNARVGNHVCILPNSVLHHDSTLGDYCVVGSQVVIAGNTHVGEKCYIGSGSSIMNGIRVVHGTLIGMGSAVIREVSESGTYAGTPARRIH